MDKITLATPKVKDWTKGQEIVTSVEQRFGELNVVTKNAEGQYSLLRFFFIGGGVEVSADVTQADVPRLLNYILSQPSKLN